jgi:D-beta-D-heptose 7-phosphate kinase/D-beta-D-heptose 1-phosphate adenosyltransferase
MDNKCKILVIGDLMLDVYENGEISRISPEAPIPIFNYKDEQKLIGGAGNVLMNLNSFGCKSEIISFVGDDKNGNFILDKIKKLGHETKNILVLKNRPTTTKTRIIADNHQVLRIDKESTEPLDSQNEKLILKKISSVLTEFNIVILSDYGKGLFSKNLLKMIIDLCCKNNIKSLVDPKGNDFTKYKNSFLLTPNISEANIATNTKIKTNHDIKFALKKLCKITNSNQQIITLSEKGIAIYDNGNFSILPALKKDIYDVTGAGDTVISSIAYKLSLNKSLKEAVKFANKAASIVVGKRGVATATIEEIENESKNSAKIFKNFKNFKNSFKKNNNEKIVFTNGCFVILHLGHVQYLKEASKLGDTLIVGLNSDISVKKLKGKNRPVNNEVDRAKMLLAFNFIDTVIIFDDKTPLDLIKEINPDVLVKGGDYKKEDIVGFKIAKETVVLDYLPNKSTSNIIKALNE